MDLKSNMKGKTVLYMLLSFFFIWGSGFSLINLSESFELQQFIFLVLFSFLAFYFSMEVFSCIYTVQFYKQGFVYRRLFIGGKVMYEDIEELLELKTGKKLGYSHYVKVKLYNGKIISFSVDCLKEDEKSLFRNILRDGTKKPIIGEVRAF